MRRSWGAATALLLVLTLMGCSESKPRPRPVDEVLIDVGVEQQVEGRIDEKGTFPGGHFTLMQDPGHLGVALPGEIVDGWSHQGVLAEPGMAVQAFVLRFKSADVAAGYLTRYRNRVQGLLPLSPGSRPIADLGGVEGAYGTVATVPGARGASGVWHGTMVFVRGHLLFEVLSNSKDPLVAERGARELGVEQAKRVPDRVELVEFPTA